jgi:hypothetical protein
MRDTAYSGNLYIEVLSILYTANPGEIDITSILDTVNSGIGYALSWMKRMQILDIIYHGYSTIRMQHILSILSILDAANSGNEYLYP